MTAPLRIVLHESHKEGEWVTHMQNMQDGGMNYGHYHDSYPEAFLDYAQRCVSLKVDPYPSDGIQAIPPGVPRPKVEYGHLKAPWKGVVVP